MRKRRPVNVAGFVVTFYPIGFASAFLESTDVPWYIHPFLVAFGALLPLTVISVLASRMVGYLGERRAVRSMRPRPRTAYLFLALGWALAGGVGALLAWAAGARSTGTGAGEDWIATGLVWTTMICACAALMMIGRMITSGGGGRPALFSRG